MSYEESRQDDLYDELMSDMGDKVRAASDEQLEQWTGRPAVEVRHWIDTESDEFDFLCHDLAVEETKKYAE